MEVLSTKFCILGDNFSTKWFSDNEKFRVGKLPACLLLPRRRCCILSV